MWTEVKHGIEVPAMPEGVWTPVFDYVRGPALIKIEATGEWRYSPSRGCGPNDELTGLSDNSGHLEVTLSIAQLAPARPPHQH
jgi:hypothetical protein